MSAQTITLEVYQGATLAFTMDYVGQDGTPAPDLDVATANLRLAQNGGGGFIEGDVDAESGTVSFEVPPFRTQRWPTDASGVGFQVWLQYDTEPPRAECVLEGTVQVREAL